MARLLIPEMSGPAGKEILLFMQFYALMIGLPFALTNRRSVVQPLVERAGVTMSDERWTPESRQAP